MIYRFDAFSLDTESLELRDGDDPVAVEPGVFSILAYLIDNRDRVVSKDELIEAIWDGRAISDGALNSRINAARRAVGDSGSAQSVIKTFPRRGFRFVGPISEDQRPHASAGLLASLPDKPSIAVLPFGNLSNDPEQEYFSDGITEDIITALSHIRQFRVVSRNSAFSFKGQSPDVRRVAQELDARYIVEGSLRRVGTRIRLTAQLIEGATGKHIWAERYDRNISDIFDLQDELTQTLIGAIEPELSKAEEGIASVKSPELLSAWDAYQRGMWHLHKKKPDDFASAKSFFERAISLDPGFASAYSGLALVLFYHGFYGATGSRQETVDKALAVAKKALELDNEDANAHSALAHVHRLRGELELVIVEAKEAIRLNPSLAEAYHDLGRAHVHHGDAEEGLIHLNEAIRLSPNDPNASQYVGGRAMAHLYLRQHEEAVEWAAKSIRYPNPFWVVRAVLASALAHLDRTAEAKQGVDDLLQYRPGINLAFVRETLPTDDQDYLGHLLNGLRMAGLPE